jgi:hypothetical protein
MKKISYIAASEKVNRYINTLLDKYEIEVPNANISLISFDLLLNAFAMRSMSALDRIFFTNPENAQALAQLLVEGMENTQVQITAFFHKKKPQESSIIVN